MAVIPTVKEIFSAGGRLFVTGTLGLTSTYATGGDTLDFTKSIYALQPGDVISRITANAGPLFMTIPWHMGYGFGVVRGSGQTNSKVKLYGSGNAAATQTLTSDATAPANNDTVTIGAQVYTFKTTLTPAAYEVLIGAAATNALDNLKSAVNATAGSGTLYGAGTVANASASAGTKTATTIVFTALISGTGGNAIASTETSAHLSFGAATFAGGVVESSNGTEFTNATAYPTDLVASPPTFLAIFRAIG